MLRTPTRIFVLKCVALTGPRRFTFYFFLGGPRCPPFKHSPVLSSLALRLTVPAGNVFLPTPGTLPTSASPPGAHKAHGIFSGNTRSKGTCRFRFFPFRCFAGFSPWSCPPLWASLPRISHPNPAVSFVYFPWFFFLL